MIKCVASWKWATDNVSVRTLSTMLFDELLDKHIGAMGRYQMLFMVLVSAEEMLMAWQAMGPVFLAATPKKYWCRHPQLYNDTIFGNCSIDERLRMTIPPGSDVTNNGLDHCLVYDKHFEPGSCQSGFSYNSTMIEEYQKLNTDSPISVDDGHLYNTTECQDWVFDKSVFASTLVTEWQLVCSSKKKSQASSVASIFLSGRILGNFLLGWMADRFGRMPVFIFSGLSGTLASLGSAFMPSYAAFVTLKFFHGALAAGRSNTALVWSIEYVGPSRRVHSIIVPFIAWSAGIMTLPALSYVMREWRHLLIAISVIEIPMYVAAYFLCSESPRWLYLTNKEDKADKIVRRMAEINGADLPKELNVEVKVQQNETSPLGLFRTPQIRLVTIAMFIIWAVCGFGYYGLSFSSGIFGDNARLTTAISGAMEIPANLLIFLILSYMGRVPMLSSCMFLTATFMLTSMAVTNNAELSWLFTALVILGRTGLTVVFNSTWVFCGECYPTCIRSIGVTWTGLGARICSPLGAYLLLLAEFYENLPLIIIGSLTVVTGFLYLLMPETRGRPMAQTIKEGEEAIRNNKLNFCRNRNNHIVAQPIYTPEEMACLQQNGSPSKPAHSDENGWSTPAQNC